MEHQDLPVPSEEMLGYTRQLLESSRELDLLKPTVNIQDSLKGLAAVMRLLNEENRPMSPSELAERAQVTDARIANILRVLQDRGLVERKQSSVDRRRAEITLTEAGVKTCEDGKRVMEYSVANFLTAFGEDNTRELIRLLDCMKETVTRLRASGHVPPEPMEMQFMDDRGNK